MTTQALAQTPTDLLAALRARGLRLWPEFHSGGVTPRLAGPATPADLAALASQQEAVLALLIREAQEAAEKDDDPAAVDRDIRWNEPAVWKWNAEA